MTTPADILEIANLVDWETFWTKDHRTEEWLAYPLIPTGRAIALYAPAKTGKSMIALAIAAAVATGRPVLGRRRHPMVDVLYLDYEMTEGDLQQRLMELGYGPDDDLSRLHYNLLPSALLDTPKGANEILELIDATCARFVVIDTFGRAVEGQEDAADTVRAFYRHTGRVLKARGITYLRTDHSGKDLAKGMRGSSAKNDDVDLVWRLSRPNTQHSPYGAQLTRTHSRISWVPAVVNVHRTKTANGFEYVHQDPATCRPDIGEIMELMLTVGVTADMSQRSATNALREAGLEVRQKDMRDALARLKEATSEPFAGASDPRKGSDALPPPDTASTQPTSKWTP